MKRTAPAIVASAAIFAFVAAAQTNAAETATIVNVTSRNIALYAKWSNLAYESQQIVLAPGERTHFWGPDGSVLFIRFNSTPGMLPARQRQYRIITARSLTPNHPGFYSYFRHIAPFVVDLFDR